MTVIGVAGIAPAAVGSLLVQPASATTDIMTESIGEVS